jgi:DNA-binding transcriptional LysR family regulator
MLFFTAMNLSAIDLNLLWVLHVVLAERSVARAAQRLHVTAPAISNALARLRSALGDPLLVRRGRGLVPTPRALELLPLLARGFAELDGALRGGPFDPGRCTRQLTLALSDADQVASLSRIAKLFARRLPRARLRVVSVDTLISSGGLAGEEVDLAIGPPLDGDGLHSVLLYEEQGVFVARRGHPRVARTIGAEQWNAERHVDIHLALGRGGVGNTAVRQALSAMGLRLEVAVTVPTFVAAASVVAQTDLISGMPLRVVRALQRSFPLQVLRGPGPPLPFQMLLHWHERTAHDPAVQAFRDVVVAALTDRRAASGRAAARRRTARAAGRASTG